MATPMSPTLLMPEKATVAPAVKDSPFVGFETIMKLLSPDDDVVTRIRKDSVDGFAQRCLQIRPMNGRTTVDSQ